MKMNQMNTDKDVSNENLDKSQVVPGQETAPNPNSKAAVKPGVGLKKKKPISSIAEMRAIAAKMKPKKMG